MIRRDQLITPDYLKTQVALHARPEGYGGKGDKWADAVVAMMRRFEAKTVLDFGCGQGSLGNALRQRGIQIAEYDPAIPEKELGLAIVDLVVCTDVLEHIEPACLQSTLKLIRSLTRKALFVVIATRASNKTLSDGRNAHLILENAGWWQRTMEAVGFTVASDPPVSPLAKSSREWVAVLTC